MCLKFCFLNLEDNACSVDNLSTIPLTAASFKLTSSDNRERLHQGQLEGGDDDSRLPQSASTSHKLDNLLVAVLYNENNMEKSEDEEEEKGTKRPRQSPEDNMEDAQG